MVLLHYITIEFKNQEKHEKMLDIIIKILYHNIRSSDFARLATMAQQVERRTRNA